MIAERIVNALLESDVDPKEFLADREPDWEMFPLHQRMDAVPGAVRRSGDGYDDQWEVPYKDWLFVLSIYEDGSHIWNAYYKDKLYSWSSEEEKARGYSWGGGGEPQKLPSGSDPLDYLERLKKMADEWPAESIWRVRTIPHMPHPDGPNRWRANY